MDLVKILQENWTVITAAPWAFVSLAVVFGSGGLLLGRFLFGERISNLESRIAHRDEEIAKLKARAEHIENKQTGDDDDTNTGKRHYLIGQLIGQYLHEHPHASNRMRMGLDNPPADWFNVELEKLGVDWRIKDDGFGEYAFVEYRGGLKHNRA